MIRLDITAVPQGDERVAHHIGVVEIVNDGAGTEDIGSYRVRYLKDGLESRAASFTCIRGDVLRLIRYAFWALVSNRAGVSR